jgi:ABC-type antimicrobial peptide transport system permease subunit
LSFAIGAGVGIAVGLLAGLVPALRASRLDPSITMRSE